MSKTIKLLFSVALLVFAGKALGQISKSPYTVQGIGDIQGMGLISNESLGGVGISLGRPFFINNINPALLALNRVTSFEIGVRAERRDLTKDTIHQTNASANFSYLVFSFPVARDRLSISFGLKPYSSVEYNVLTTQNISGSSSQANVNLRGTGGLNQAYFATGARFFKNLFIGARAGYFFGSIIDETSIEPFVIEDNDTVFVSLFKSNYYRRTSYSKAGLGIGMVYSMKVRKDVLFNIGGIYDLQTTLATKNLETLEHLYFNDEVSGADTLVFNEDGHISLPPRYGLGISLENGLLWAAAVDFTMQDWSQFANYKGESEGLKNTYRISAGTEFIPDITSVTSYFQRALYRLGFHYQTTPYSKNNVQVKEFGINFGAGLPISGGSLFNLMFEYGQRGLGENLIKEDIFRISLGFTFNDSRWFYRRKYD